MTAKVLPESVARDHEALARFEREAKAVETLSHPDILRSRVVRRLVVKLQPLTTSRPSG